MDSKDPANDRADAARWRLLLAAARASDNPTDVFNRIIDLDEMSDDNAETDARLYTGGA